MNFINISTLSREDIINIIKITNNLFSRNGLPLLGKTFVLFFPESSIRTRLTFEKGIKELGGKVILFPPSTLDKREKLLDVVKYIENWADCIIVRHRDYKKVLELSNCSKIPVINAMTAFNHPCEILTDIYSISKIKEKYETATYTFVGGKGNILNSWINLAEKLDLSFYHVSTDSNKIKENSRNYNFTSELDEALLLSDIVLTDSLDEKYKNNEYYDKFQITVDNMQLCNDEAILNPCPPFYRGEEVSHDVIESKYFVGYEFKKNLIYVQQAIILYCLDLVSLKER